MIENRFHWDDLEEPMQIPYADPRLVVSLSKDLESLLINTC